MEEAGDKLTSTIGFSAFPELVCSLKRFSRRSRKGSRNQIPSCSFLQALFIPWDVCINMVCFQIWMGKLKHLRFKLLQFCITDLYRRTSQWRHHYLRRKWFTRTQAIDLASGWRMAMRLHLSWMPLITVITFSPLKAGTFKPALSSIDCGGSRLFRNTVLKRDVCHCFALLDSGRDRLA